MTSMGMKPSKADSSSMLYSCSLTSCLVEVLLMMSSRVVFGYSALSYLWLICPVVSKASEVEADLV